MLTPTQAIFVPAAILGGARIAFGRDDSLVRSVRSVAQAAVVGAASGFIVSRFTSSPVKIAAIGTALPFVPGAVLFVGVAVVMGFAAAQRD